MLNFYKCNYKLPKHVPTSRIIELSHLCDLARLVIAPQQRDSRLAGGSPDRDVGQQLEPGLQNPKVFQTSPERNRPMSMPNQIESQIT